MTALDQAVKDVQNPFQRQRAKELLQHLRDRVLYLERQLVELEKKLPSPVVNQPPSLRVV